MSGRISRHRQTNARNTRKDMAAGAPTVSVHHDARYLTRHVVVSFGFDGAPNERWYCTVSAETLRKAYRALEDFERAREDERRKLEGE